MKLMVVSHKPCWRSPCAESGTATDGGFAYQIGALSELFDETVLVVPVSATPNPKGEVPISGKNLRVVPLTTLEGTGFRRKLRVPGWAAQNVGRLYRQMTQADAVHAPIPGDVGTVGMLLATALGKPLFVRHCGNWLVQRTAAERFWKWFMERYAGGNRVMLATGAAQQPPSRVNSQVRWIFSSSLRAPQLEASQAKSILGKRTGFRLIIVGRQELGKGTDVVIRSLPQITKWCTLDVVGAGSALTRFQELADSLQLQSRVTFHGKVPPNRVLELLRGADLFCYPTQSEGFPKVVLEALCSGLPVITTKVSALPELLRPGGGVLLDDTSPETMAAAVDHCLEDPIRFQTMSSAAVETARQYSLENWRDTIGDKLRAAWGPLRAEEFELKELVPLALSGRER